MMRSLLLISFATLALAEQCSRWTCETSEHPLGTNDCSTGVVVGQGDGSYDQFYVKACPKGSKCPPNSILPPQACELNDVIAYPGAKCSSGTRCFPDTAGVTTHCVKGVCQGLAKNEACKGNEYCDAGLYCAGGKCVSQQKEGDSCTKPMEIGAECSNNLVCNNDSKCAKLFHAGTEDSCRSNLECKAGYCAPEDGKCYKAESEHKHPHKCETSGLTSECVSKKVKGNTINADCQCGYNNSGDKYCGQLQYDYYGKKFYEKCADIAKEDWLMKCNISAQKDGLDACIRSYADSDDAEEYFYYYQQYHLYYMTVDTESCVLDTFYPTFNDADDDYAEDSDFAAALILPLFFGLI